MHNVCGVSRGKGDRTGKLYWASFVERPELAGISGRGGRAVTLTSRAPCWVTSPSSGEAGPSAECDNHTEYAASTGANYFIGP